jgi:cytidylate kinase
MYRACTFLALRGSVDIEDAVALTALAAATTMDIVVTPEGERLLTNGEDVTPHLRTTTVQALVSHVAKVAGVRVAMVNQQQQMAKVGEVIMVGRDIGTKVVPHAGKVYLNTSAAERVRRRLAEVAGTETEAEVRANLELRDKIDSEREESPLRVADDAVVVDTDDLDVEGVVGAIIAALGVDA